MTSDEARELIINGINYAAYRETDSSLYDSDKNRLFGSEHYRSGRNVPGPVLGLKVISRKRWRRYFVGQTRLIDPSPPSPRRKDLSGMKTR
jgi:hypothetical protein